MVDDYLEWTGGIEASASQLPTGIYDFYVYSHDGNIQLSVGGTNYGIKNAYEGFPLSHPNPLIIGLTSNIRHGSLNLRMDRNLRFRNTTKPIPKTRFPWQAPT